MEKLNKDATNKCRIITPTFKAGYVNVFEAIQEYKKAGANNTNSVKKFSITMFFNKKETDMTPIFKAIESAKFAKWPNKVDWPEELHNPIKDGDKPKYVGKEGHKGHYFIKATANEFARPGVVNFPDLEDIVNRNEFYSGCFARAKIFARVWDNGMGKQGVQFILDHVVKMKDGKPFGGKESAKEAFGALAVDLDDENEETIESNADSFM